MVLMNAVDQYLDDVAALDPDGDPGIGWASLGSGLSFEQWRAEQQRLGEQISHVEYGDTAAHRALIERMHRLLPHGKSYPRDAEAYVISPEMHNVVRAAALTVTPDDLFTIDPTSDLPTPAGLLLLPTVCGSDGGVYAPISAIGWRPESGPWSRADRRDRRCGSRGCPNEPISTSSHCGRMP